jgi:hypothetical protein
MIAASWRVVFGTEKIIIMIAKSSALLKIPENRGKI